MPKALANISFILFYFPIKRNHSYSYSKSITKQNFTKRFLMEQVKFNIGLVLVTLTLLYASATAQSSCKNEIVSLFPCLDYVTGNSSTPTTGCCTQLANVVKSQPECLCLIIGGEGSSLGINQTLALALPAACNVQTPRVSLCKSMSSKLNLFIMYN